MQTHPTKEIGINDGGDKDDPWSVIVDE